MAELTISPPEEIRSAISSYVSSLESQTSREEVGTVTDTGDGIAHVEGLPSAMTNELLEFEGGVRGGVALNLDQREIGAVILGDYAGIEEGQPVRRTNSILSVPVGDAFLGRVIDPPWAPDRRSRRHRGRDGACPRAAGRHGGRAAVRQGAAADRHQAIDAMTPIGRGQRQLIIGDRKTGKTAVCVDTIINQKNNWASGDPSKQVRCIYVAIGQKAPRSPVSARRWRTLAPWSTRRSSPPPRRTRPASSGSRPTPARRSASTGCTRQARPDRVRRPVQAGRGLPRDLAAAAPPAGP